MRPQVLPHYGGKMDNVVFKRGNNSVWESNSIPNGEVCVTEEGTYIYVDNEMKPFPQFCVTCEFNDSGRCKKLHTCFGDRLTITDDFYCGYHKLRKDFKNET
jgi:hypothetical protein